jgi:hypothetical protein
MVPAFAFLDLDHPVVAWGAYRGVLVSANVEYRPPQCPVSMMFAGIVLHQNNVRLQNELLIERHRQLHFPNCTSRLAGMYFFEDRVTAEQACEWGGHFSSENLAEFELFPSEAYSRHDANWISYAPLCKAGRIESEGWIAKYWSGEVYPGRAPVWELLVQGRAVICGTELRERAYKVVLGKFPESVSILEISRIAAHVGSDLGHVSAWAIREDDGSLTCSFFLDMRDADRPEFLERVRQYNGPRNYKDLAVGGEYFGVPDFREFSSTFAVTEGVSDAFLFSVHRNTEI